MTDIVVDTNVPVVANGRDGEYAVSCIQACIDRLEHLRKHERVVLDLEMAVLDEYKTYLRSSGQPGPGDAFYLHVLRHIGDDSRTEIVDLVPNQEREYELFPDAVELEDFDRSDRKFAALAVATGAAVLNAVDSDWLEYEDPLRDNGIEVEFVCGRDALRKR